MSETPNTAIGIDIGKYTFHAVGHNARGEPGGLSHEVSFAPVNGHHQANRSGPKSAPDGDISRCRFTRSPRRRRLAVPAERSGQAPSPF
jgi:hypothetical protein